ncbi:MAG: tRNA (guanosine(46)-N7)-methyltransferase TrmB [Pseudomonadota bacterium]
MNTPKRHDGAPWRNFYGRRHGKQLRPGQAEHMETTLRALQPEGVDWESNPNRTPLDLEALFGRTAPLHLEIGFGSGEHLFAQAQRTPERNFLGCEPFVNGVATLVPRVAEAGLTNIRIHPGDGRDLLDVLPSASVARTYLLYPDPWPKARHHRRRFMTVENLEPLAQAMAPGAALFVATDIEDYVRQSLEVVQASPHFSWSAKGPEDWRTPWPHWHRTRYEAKALREGGRPHYLKFSRNHHSV